VPSPQGKKGKEKRGRKDALHKSKGVRPVEKRPLPKQEKFTEDRIRTEEGASRSRAKKGLSGEGGGVSVGGVQISGTRLEKPKRGKKLLPFAGRQERRTYRARKRKEKREAAGI